MALKRLTILMSITVCVVIVAVAITTAIGTTTSNEPNRGAIATTISEASPIVSGSSSAQSVSLPAVVSGESSLSTITMSQGGNTIYPVTITLLNSSTTKTSVAASPSSEISMVSASPSSSVLLYYKVSSSISGTFYVTINEPGAFVSVGLIENRANFTLPSGIQATYPKGDILTGQNTIVIPIKMNLTNAVSTGTIPLQITAYQHQWSGPGGYAGSSIPILIQVS